VLSQNEINGQIPDTQQLTLDIDRSSLFDPDHELQLQLENVPEENKVRKANNMQEQAQ